MTVSNPKISRLNAKPDGKRQAKRPKILPKVRHSAQPMKHAKPAENRTKSIQTSGLSATAGLFAIFSPLAQKYRKIKVWSYSNRKKAGWVATLLVTFFGAFLRFFRLGQPQAVVFDETYYVKDAWTMLMTGEPKNWPEAIAGTPINDLFASGQVYDWLDSAEYVVHPPVGKWIIALGLKLFGGAENVFAWRAAAAIAGTVGIILICRIVLRIFNSISLAVLAGFFMSIDGVGITMSRTGLLDIFIMVFVLGAFDLLLIHYEKAKKTIWDYAEQDTAEQDTTCLDNSNQHNAESCKAAKSKTVKTVKKAKKAPYVFFSWQRLSATVLLGLATAVKWSGIYFFAAFALLSVFLDAYERHKAGYKNWLLCAIGRDGPLSALYMIPVYLCVYLTSWTSWFIHSDSYMRYWAEKHPDQGITWLNDSMRSFIEYHRQMWSFHTTLNTPHDYMANPLTWPIQLRPTSFYWRNLTDHPGLCSLSPDTKCIAAVTSLGNPVLWWLGTLCAILAPAIGIFVRRGDCKLWFVAIGFIGGWLPWVQYLNRTTFTFYSIVILPWIIISICYVADWIKEVFSPVVRTYIIRLSTAIIFAASIFFYPIWTAMPVPYDFWYMHMWFSSWI